MSGEQRSDVLFKKDNVPVEKLVNQLVCLAIESEERGVRRAGGEAVYPG